jgi:integrase
MIEVRLEPRDMEIKFDKPRVVHVPYSLMESLHRYTLFERNRLASRSDVKARELILTVHGRAFGKDAVGDFCRSISKVVGHRVTALMLRHSYAIHTLMTLRASKIFRGEPLLYVRDRLGHSNVQTTMVYLRQIERLTGHVALAMAAEFDQVFGVARSAQA